MIPSGLSRESFYKHYWEKKPLLISNSKNLAEPDSDGRIFGEDLYLDKEAKQLYERRFDGFLSEKGIKAMISDRPMKYGKDVNVTNYCNIGSGEKRRITLDQLPDTNGDIDGEFEFVTTERCYAVKVLNPDNKIPTHYCDGLTPDKDGWFLRSNEMEFIKRPRTDYLIFDGGTNG